MYVCITGYGKNLLLIVMNICLCFWSTTCTGICINIDCNFTVVLFDLLNNKSMKDI